MPRFLDFFTHLGANHSSNVRSTLPSALQASKSCFFQSLLTSLVSLHLSNFIGSVGSESENISPNSLRHIISFLLPFLSMASKTHLKSTSLSMPRSVAFFSQSGANHSSNVSCGYCGFFPSVLQALKSSLCQSLLSSFVPLHLASFIGSVGSESENIIPNSPRHISSFFFINGFKDTLEINIFIHAKISSF